VHAYVPEALPPAQRTVRLNAMRQERSCVLLFQGGGPPLGSLKAVTAAIFFDQDPTQATTLHHSLATAEAALPPLFYIVSGERACDRSTSPPGWEEAALTSANQAPVPLAQACAGLVQAERACASARMSAR